jgi:hypothetical protein
MTREEGLGTCIPTVFQGDNTMPLLDAVLTLIRRNKNYGVLQTEIQYITVYTPEAGCLPLLRNH